MFCIVRYFAVLFSLVFACPIFASSEHYNFAQCLEMIFKHNPEIQAARANLTAADYQKSQIWSDFLPRLSAGLSMSDQTLERRTTSLLNPINSTNGQSFSASIDASLNLFAGMRDRARMGQASDALDASRAKFIMTSARIIYELKVAFENLQYAQNNQKLTQEIIRRREENLKIVELRFEGGLENKGSVLLSQAYLAQARYDELQARNSELTARRQLARVLGIDDYAKLNIQYDLATSEPPLKPNLEEIAQTTPEYRESVYLEQSAEKNIDVVEANFYPSLTLTGSLRQVGQDYFPTDSKQEVIGLSLNIPLFDGGKDYYGRKSAVENFVAQKSQRINVSRNLLARLQEQLASYQEADAKLKADQLFVTATTVRAQIARNKYNNGLLTFENWDIIESDLINRQKTLLMTQRQRVLVEAAWNQTLAKGIEL
jgi:outer membrane protein TolC